MRISTGRALGVLAGLSLAAAAPAAEPAAPPEIPTASFAARSPFGDAKVSPDGSRIAMAIDIKGKHNLAVMDASSKTFIDRTQVDVADTTLEWFRWAGNDRIIFSLSSPGRILDTDVRYTRLYVLDLATEKTSYVGGKQQGLEGDDVLYVDPKGEYVLLSMQPDVFTEPEVRRFPLDGSNTDNDEKVVGHRTNLWQWITDDAGVVRVGLGWSGGKIRVIYRKNADDDFKTIAKLSPDDEDDKSQLYDALRIISGSDEGLTLDKGPGGKVALRKINYETGDVGDVIYENKDWDVTDFDVDPQGNPVAAYYTDDRDRIVWLKPELAHTQQQLEKALGNKEEVWITSRAKDNSRMIVWEGNASDPGAYYLYSPGKHTLEELAEMRPDIPLQHLAPVKPVSYAARDGTEIRAYLTLPKGRAPKGLPLIIMPHGGPYGIRDKLDYDDWVQLLANRGYAVLQPNYRGSGGYGEDFEKLGDGQIGRAMQDDLDDAMDWAVAQGFADAKRVCVVGASYGGYAAMWAVIRNPERYRCAASFAGVTDWKRQLVYDADFFSRKGRKAWRNRVRGEDNSFNLDDVSPAEKAGKLTRPILLAHGKQDSNVPYSQFTRMRDALRRAKFDQAEYLVFDKEGHGFNTPEDEQKWYDALIAFLAKNDPAS